MELAKAWALYLWRLLLAYAAADPMVALAFKAMAGLLAFAVLVFVLCMVAAARASTPAQKRPQQAKEKKRQASSRFEKWLTWLVPPGDPWLVGDVIVDFTWLAHCLIWGTTGSGKSTFVRTRILRPWLGFPGVVVGLIRVLTCGRWPSVRHGRRGCLVFAGNMSKPFRAAVLWLMEHGYPCLIWEPDPTPGSGFGLDVLEGPPDNVGQRLIKAEPVSSGDTGLRSGAVEGMLVDTIYVIDRAEEPRNFANILKYIHTVGIRDLDESGNPTGQRRPMTNQEKAGLENWCTRFATLRRRLGACIGNDYKLSEVLAQGYVVFVQGSSYNNPNSIDQLTNLFVYYVMWLVSTVGNFDFIVDEPGAVEKGTFTRLLTATRAQGVRIMICPQSLDQIDKTLREMCTTVLLLGTAAGAPEAGELASDLVHKDIDAVDFTLLKPTNWRERVAFWRSRRGLRACTGYLLDNGRLDKVKTSYADIKIIDRYPKGSIPKLKPPPTVLKDIVAMQSQEAGEIVQGSSTGEGKGIDWGVVSAAADGPVAKPAGKPVGEELPAYINVPDLVERRARMLVWSHLCSLGVGRDGERVQGLNVHGVVTPCRVAKEGIRMSDGRPYWSYRGSKFLGHVMIYAWANNVDWESFKAMFASKGTKVSMRPSVHHTCHDKTCCADDHLELRNVSSNAWEQTQWAQEKAAAGSE